MGCDAHAGDVVAKEETIVSGMAGRYALALHQLAQETRAGEAVTADLERFLALLDESPDLNRLVKSPVFSAQEQIKALDAVLAAAGIAGVAARFIRLVASKRRLFALPDMIAGYKALQDRSKGVTRAQVTVAQPLSPAHLATLRQALADVTRQPAVEVAVQVDPSIIGGLVVKLGSRMVDGSLRTKLNTIRTRMKEVG